MNETNVVWFYLQNVYRQILSVNRFIFRLRFINVIGSMSIEFTERKMSAICRYNVLQNYLAPLRVETANLGYQIWFTSTVYVLKTVTNPQPASHKFNSVPSLSTNTTIPLFQSRNLIPTWRHPNPFGYHCSGLEDVKSLRDDSVTTPVVRSSHINTSRTRSRDTEVDR